MMMMQCLLVAAIPAIVVHEAPLDDMKKELEKLQGTWKLESVEVEGQKAPPEAFKGVRLTIKGDKFSFTESNTTFGGTFKVDLLKKPNTIDISFTEGPEKGTTTLGIYEVEGDTWKICLNPKGAKRPAEFRAKQGTGEVLEVFKREKP